MRRDLALVVAFACLAFVVALLPVAAWLDSALLIPLVLVLPGYAVAAVLFPPGTIGPAERGIYTIALSIGIAAVGGLLLQVAIGLDRGVWAALLTIVTIFFAWRGLLSGERSQPVPAMPRSLPLALVVFAAAAAIAGLAISSAVDGLHDAQARIRFTDFWLLPKGNAAVEPNAEIVSVGVRSQERAFTRYTVQLSREGRPFASRHQGLRTGEQREWDFTVTKAPHRAPLVAELIRDGEPYRKLDIVLPR